MGLEDVVRESAGKAANAAVFNNAAQVWNHTFYWNSLAPKPSAPSGKLVQAIEAYGGLDKLKADLAEAATTQFGSGWAWLVAEDGKLAIRKTANAETPMVRGTACLLTIDVWEHAYYLDYQNKRAGLCGRRDRQAAELGLRGGKFRKSLISDNEERANCGPPFSLCSGLTFT